MSISSVNYLLRDHVLYKLQDKATRAVKGFALIKKTEQDTPDNCEGFDFVPASSGSLGTEGCGGLDQASSGQSRTDQEEKSSIDQETILFLAQTIQQEEFLKREIDTLETDLNLSEASSTNETTLDECHSQSSHTSPKISPEKILFDQEGTQSAKSQISQVLPSGNICAVKSDELLIIKEEAATGPVLAHSTSSLSSLTVADLAAEVVSKIKSKLCEEEVSVKKDKSSRLVPSIYKKTGGPVSGEKVIEYFESMRNAKEDMSSEEFSKLSKPFQFGWRRDCVVQDDGYEISGVYYITPPNGKAEGKRMKYPAMIVKYLSEMGITNLSLENFSTRKAFLGFGPQQELLRTSFKSSKHADVNGRGGWKYDNFYETVNHDEGGRCETRYKCLLCGRSFTQKGNFGRHVKVYHEPDQTCNKCGKEFRPIHFQDHRSKCKVKCKDLNENLVIKRKRSTEAYAKPLKFTKREEEEKYPNIVPSNNITFDSSPSNTKPFDISPDDRKPFDSSPSKPVAKKSSPTCPVSTSSLVPEKVRISEVSIKDATDEEADCEIGKPVIFEDSPSRLPDIAEVTKSAGHQSEEKAIHSVDELSKGEGLTTEPKSKGKISDIVSTKNETIRMAILEMASAEGTRIRMQVKVHAKLVKGMKKFGERMGVRHENLLFKLNGVELTGEELAGGLDGTKILVERRVAQ